MKKLIVIAVLSIMVLPFVVSAKPMSTWQVYRGGILTVYSGDSANSPVYYQGVPSGYDGGAVDTISPYIPGVMSTGSSTPSL